MITRWDILKITGNLVLVYVVGGLLLGAVYISTAPVIYQNGINEKKAALRAIMPAAGKIEKLGEWDCHEKKAEYFSASNGNAPCGYVIESYGKGYSGAIHMLIALDTLGKVLRISVLAHAETPGLGDEIESGWFKNQFAGKDISQMLVTKTNAPGRIQAISGATISSRAVTEDAVKHALEFIGQAVVRKRIL